MVHSALHVRSSVPTLRKASLSQSLSVCETRRVKWYKSTRDVYTIRVPWFNLIVCVKTVEHSQSSIVAQVDAWRAANITRNREVLKSIARAVLFCGRQCIALRGDGERIEMNDTFVSGNPGNFLALLKLLAVNDDVLRSHLEAPAMRCATYISPAGLL